MSLNSLSNLKGENKKKPKKMVKAFREETDSEMLCHKITGKHFTNINDHSEYINGQGCAKLMDVLAEIGA